MHLRVRDCTPPPHVTLQAPQIDHNAHESVPGKIKIRSI